MYRSICLPLQQSDQQESAQAFAQTLADTFGSELTGIRTTSTSRHTQRRDRLVDLLPEDWRPSGAALAVVEEEVAKTDDLPFETRSVDGSDVGGLSDVMAEGDYDLLVLPATRHGDADTIGPLAERLVRRSRQDVLIVKSTEPAADDAPIVVCIDGSQEAYGGL